MFGNNSAFPWQPPPVVFPPGKKTPLGCCAQTGATQLLDPLQILPFEAGALGGCCSRILIRAWIRVLQSRGCTLPDIPGDYRTLQPCPAPPPRSRPKRKGSRRLAYIALEKKIMKQFPRRVLKRELLSSDGLLGAGTKGLSGPAAFKLQSVLLGKRHRNEPRAA